MKLIKTLSAALGLLALSLPVFAVPVAYPFRVVDNSGTLVPGATISIGSTTLTAGSPTSVPASAGEKVLTTNASPGAAVSLTLLDYGTGDYAIVSDPAVNGELYLPLTVSKSGSTITAGNALIALVASSDPSGISTAATNTGTLITGQGTLVTGQTAITAKTSLIATNAADSPNAVTAQGQAATAATQSTATAVNTGTLLTGQTNLQTGITALLGRTPQTGDTYALVSPLISAGKFTTAALSNAPTSSGGASAASIAALILSNPSVPLSNDTAGRVLLQPSQAFANSTASTVPPTWYSSVPSWYTAPPSLPTEYLTLSEQAKLGTAATAQQAGTAVTLPSTVLQSADLTALTQAILLAQLHGVSIQRILSTIYLTTAGAVAPAKTGTVSTNAFKWPDGVTGQTSTVDSSTSARTETPGTLPN